MSWVDLSRDRYIALAKLATPAGNHLLDGYCLLEKNTTRPSKLHVSVHASKRGKKARASHLPRQASTGLTRMLVPMATLSKPIEGGGWTLVWSYTFTAYSSFTSGANAVPPRPTWTASKANTRVSTAVPLGETHYEAMNFASWRTIEKEFLIKSNINNWIALRGEIWKPRDAEIGVPQL